MANVRRHKLRVGMIRFVNAPAGRINVKAGQTQALRESANTAKQIHGVNFQRILRAWHVTCLLGALRTAHAVSITQGRPL